MGPEKAHRMSPLAVRKLSRSFGGLQALDDISFELRAGERRAIIGPNGAGKTTLFNVINGQLSPSSGEIWLMGSNVTRLPTHRRAALGLGRTWQSLELFDDLSVEENLQVAGERQTAASFLLDIVRPRRLRDRTGVEFALDVLGIGDLATRMPNEISQGQRKLVSAARALAARPKLVCMDEPAAGLDTHESRQLGDRLRDIIATGTTILLVDHDMSLVLEVCDYIYVIEFGNKIAEGTPAQIAGNRHVVEAYLGQDRAASGTAPS